MLPAVVSKAATASAAAAAESRVGCESREGEGGCASTAADD